MTLPIGLISRETRNSLFMREALAGGADTLAAARPAWGAEGSLTAFGAICTCSGDSIKVVMW